MFDITHITYDEKVTGINIFHKTNFCRKYPYLINIKNVKGILNAHIEAAKQIKTTYFFAVDADLILLDEFNFDYGRVGSKEYKELMEEPKTLVWKTMNRYNDLIYGHGGVKLLHRETLLNQSKMGVDMTTALTSNFEIIDEVCGETYFMGSPFHAWRGAFRECVKLSAKLIPGQIDTETETRLAAWESGNKIEYYDWIIAGVKLGKKFGEEYKNNLEAMKKINDFDWLTEKFKECYEFKNDSVVRRSNQIKNLVV